MPDMVNHPPHYTRGPTIGWPCPDCDQVHPGTVECIEVIRHVRDMRLATSLKYVWRVAFGGKENDRENIQKAIWYLQDYLDNQIDGAQ